MSTPDEIHATVSRLAFTVLVGMVLVGALALAAADDNASRLLILLPAMAFFVVNSLLLAHLVDQIASLKRTSDHKRPR